jgi:hypothetical protein
MSKIQSDSNMQGGSNNELDKLIKEKESIRLLDMPIEEKMDLLGSINRQIEREIRNTSPKEIDKSI